MRRKYNYNAYKDLPVNNHIRDGKGNLIENRLSKTYLVLCSAIGHAYSKVIQQHFTLTLPTDYSNSYTIELLYKRFKDKLDRDWRKDNNKRRKLHYIATIEIESSKNAHIHFMTFTDSNRNQHRGVTMLVEAAWKHALTSEIDDNPVAVCEYKSGLIEHKRDTYLGLDRYQHLIDKNDLESIEQAMYWASYLCKNRGKSKLDKFKASNASKTASNLDSVC